MKAFRMILLAAYIMLVGAFAVPFPGMQPGSEGVVDLSLQIQPWFQSSAHESQGLNLAFGFPVPPSKGGSDGYRGGKGKC